jgi:hypothetical protein
MLKGMYGVTTATYAAIRELVHQAICKILLLVLLKMKEGNLKCIDVSAVLVYDTVQNPIISIIASVEKENVFAPNEPLTVGVGKGLAKGVARFMRPFVDESIYLNVFNNLLLEKE